MCLESLRWFSPARRLTWVAQTIFSRRETYTERNKDMSSTASVRTSRTRDIPSSRLLYRLVPSERRTGVTGCGLLRGGKMQDMMLKTPTAMDAEIGSPKSDPKSGDSGCLAQEIMGGYAVILPTPFSVSVRHPGRVSELRMAGDVTFCSRAVGETRPNGLEDWLQFHGLMPSPVSQDFRRRGPNSRQQGLPELCHKLMPTPTAMDSSEATARMRSSQMKEGSMHSVTLARAVQSRDSKDGKTSQLNPLFVGEMMGYPLEWLTLSFLSESGERRL